MSTPRTIFVIIEGETTFESFPVEIDLNKTVGHLKQLIKEANPTTLNNIDARKLKVWGVDISLKGPGNQPILLEKYPGKEALLPNVTIYNLFKFDASVVSIVVQIRMYLYYRDLCFDVSRSGL